MSRGALWTARVLSALGVLFLLFDATIKVAMIQPVIDSAAMYLREGRLAPLWGNARFERLVAGG